MNEIIYIREAAELLGYKKLSSVERWCNLRGIQIFSEEGTNRKYVIAIQFQYARLKKFIKYLQERFGENWMDAFKAYTSEDIIHVVEIEETGKIIQDLEQIKRGRSSKGSYIPAGEHGKTFLARLKSLSKNFNNI